MGTPNFFLHEIFDEFNDPWEERLLTNPMRVENGFIQPPELPGLGTDLNFEEIAKHPYNVGNWLPLFRRGWEKRKSNN